MHIGAFRHILVTKNIVNFCGVRVWPGSSLSPTGYRPPQNGATAHGPEYWTYRRRLGGVTQRMLTRTLRQLERDGLILRRDHEDGPPRVDYALTTLGERFLLQIIPVWLWIFDHADDFRKARLASSISPD